MMRGEESSELEESSSAEEIERTESTEAEAVERQSLEDATIEPESVVEQSGDIQQAEAIEKVVTEITPTTTESSEVEYHVADDVIKEFSPEQQEVFETFDESEKETFKKMIEKTPRIIPDGVADGHSGGLIY